MSQSAEVNSISSTPDRITSRRRVLDLLLFVALTLLVWGLFALDHGLWQDDALRLGTASEALNGGEAPIFRTGVMPSRVLVPLIYVAVLTTGKPVLLLTILYGLAWLANGILAAAVARELFEDDEIGFLAGCLTLTATSDYLTNSLVALGYTASMALFLGALLLACRYVRYGGSTSLWRSTLLLAGSTWMTDVGLVPLCLTPLMLWASYRGGFRRTLTLTAVWVVASAPYAIALIGGLRYSDYSKVAFLDVTFAARVRRALGHFAYNFTPWRWAFDRPEWFPEPAPVLPRWIYVGATLIGVAAFLVVGIRRRFDEQRTAHSPSARPGWMLVVLLAASVFGTNLAYSGIIASDAFYRTHLGSRVWSSVMIAALLVGIGSRIAPNLGIDRRRVLPVALLLSIGFIAPGIWGGIERQDYFLSCWRQHRQEVLSIREALPALRPDAQIVLWQPPTDTFLATKAAYLGLAWMRLLHGHWPANQIWLRSPSRDAECIADPDGIRCSTEGCPSGEPCWSPLLPWESLAIIQFDAKEGRYHLAKSLPRELSEGAAHGAARYSPERQIVKNATESPIIKDLLAGDRLLARIVPNRSSRADEGPAPAAARLEFDEAITYGTGWEKQLPGRSNKWMLEPVTTLNVRIAGGRDLCVTAAISHFLAADIPASLTLTANGISIPIQRSAAESRTLFKGVVPAAAIPSGKSNVELAFEVGRLVAPSSLGINADTRPLGLLFDWLTLEPCPPSAARVPVSRPPDTTSSGSRPN